MKIGDKVMYVGKSKEFMGRMGSITSFPKAGATHVNFGDTILICMSSELQLIEEQPVHGSMTKREQFAMAAMQAYVNNYYSDKSIEHCAKTAIKMADELLKQLEK